MSTHNICFRGDIRKIFTRYPPLSRPMWLLWFSFIWGLYTLCYDLLRKCLTRGWCDQSWSMLALFGAHMESCPGRIRKVKYMYSDSGLLFFLVSKVDLLLFIYLCYYMGMARCCRGWLTAKSSATFAISDMAAFWQGIHTCMHLIVFTWNLRKFSVVVPFSHLRIICQLSKHGSEISVNINKTKAAGN